MNVAKQRTTRYCTSSQAHMIIMRFNRFHSLLLKRVREFSDSLTTAFINWNDLEKKNKYTHSKACNCELRLVHEYCDKCCDFMRNVFNIIGIVRTYANYWTLEQSFVYRLDCALEIKSPCTAWRWVFQYLEDKLSSAMDNRGDGVHINYRYHCVVGLLWLKILKFLRIVTIFNTTWLKSTWVFFLIHGYAIH